MAKGNLFLGFGRGKLGSVVMYRANGEQVTRARNRSPKNPQSALQLLQRTVMHTASSAYSYFSRLTDHSFQGLAPGTPNQSRFLKLNVAMLREYLADEINSADPAVISASRKYNFMAKNAFGCVINKYIISEGSLPVMGAYMTGSSCYLRPRNASLPDGTVTYANIVDYLGAQQGDQLTFVEVLGDSQPASGHDPYFTGLRVARVILEPGDDFTMGAGFFAGNTVGHPNPANEGYIRISAATVTPGEEQPSFKAITFSLLETEQPPSRYYPIGCAVILSRRSSNTWLRSSETLTLIDTESISNQLDGAYLGDAIMSYLSENNSTLYLNQAENL